MRARLDHIGIAVADLQQALAFYKDALGLEIDPPEDVASQRVRAHFIPAGESALELLEPTADDSAIAKYVAKRGPGLHHITLRVDDIQAALAQLKARGVRLIDEQPRLGAHGSLVAFIHPSSAHGVLVELKEGNERKEGKEAREAKEANEANDAKDLRPLRLGDLELLPLLDRRFRLDGGAMFGIIPKPLWAKRQPPDDRNRISLAMRPLLVRGERRMIIDAGAGDKLGPKLEEIYGLDKSESLDASLAAAGLTADDIEIVLASHLHFDHAGGFTRTDTSGQVVPRFPRAKYHASRGEYEDATRPHERNRGSYFAENYVPLQDAGVLQFWDTDRTIMPGVRVRRTGGHTRCHHIVYLESGGRTAVFAADLLPTTAHVDLPWIMAYDLYPMETLEFKRAFLREAIDGEYLIFFEHDPAIAAGFIREDGKRVYVEPLTSAF